MRPPSLFLTGLLTFALLSGCKKGSDDPETDGPASFDRATLLHDVAEDVVLPAYATLATAGTEHAQRLHAFHDAPTLDNLLAARTAWNGLMDAWMACEPFRFGAQYTQNLNQRIAYTPIDAALIENEIAGSGPIDAAYIANAGVTRKGLHAVEYLLYHDADVNAVLAAFTTGPNAERRRTFLASLGPDIADRIGVVQHAWSPSGGNYAATFAGAVQSDINGSLNILVNAWIEHIELVRREKVQLPSGIELGDVPNPNAAESRLSGRSIANIRIAVQQWKRILTSAGGLGIDDNLSAVGAQYQGTPLAQKIAQELDVALANCDAITAPLTDAVTTQQPQVQALYLTLKRLTVLTKIDAASNLGVIVTLSDSDGD